MRRAKRITHRLIDLEDTLKSIKRSKYWDDPTKARHRNRMRKLGDALVAEAKVLE
jgi:hypothetical protein